MRCSLHCPPAARSVAARVVAVLIVLVVVRLAWLVVSSVAEAFALAVFAVAAALLVVLVRVLRYGGLRKPACRKAAYVISAIPAPAALPAPRLAITSARAVPGVVLGAAEGERVEQWAGQ